MMDGREALEQELERLARAMVYPATPELARTVRLRLERGARTAAAAAPRWRLAAVALAAGMVALAFVISVAAPAREAVADFLERIRIFQVEEAPAGLPTDISGTPVSLEEAGARLGFPLKLPTYPEGVKSSLRRVLYQEFEPVELRAAVLFFEPAEGAPFVLFETNAAVGKGLGPGAEAEAVPELGEAYWLEGLRIVQYYDPQGNFVRESQRQTEANTLVWAEEGLVFRLEGELSQEEAVRIARSLR